MFSILKSWFLMGSLVDRDLQLDHPLMKQIQTNMVFEQIQRLSIADRHALGHSLHIRHVDVGSNNAEEAELIALSSPFYDLSRFGIEFTASPRHADVLAVTGPVTRHLKLALERTYQAAPQPCLVMAIGDGACYGQPYEQTYACLGPVNQFLPVDVYIPGDPPSPLSILTGFLRCKYLLLQTHP